MSYQLFKLSGQVIVASVFMCVAAILFAGNAHAAGGVGGGAGGGGGSGGGTYGYPHSDKGYGWHLFNADGSYRPDYFRDGTSWAQVAATCRDTQYVVAFVVMEDYSQNGSHGAVYKDDGGWGTYRYLSGGNWLSYSQASSMFDTVPPHLKWGYTFGNNVAWFCYLDRATQWYINGQSYIKNSPYAGGGGRQQGTITAKPGDRLNWYHDMRNVGPQDMDRDVYFNVDKTGFSNGWNSTHDPLGNARGGVGSLFVWEYADDPRGARPYTLYDVTQNDVGNTLCQRIAWIQGSWNDGGWWWSNWACAAVPYNYTLTPSIAVGPPRGSSGSSISVDPVVNNAGPTKSHNVQWQVTRFKVAPNNVVPHSTGGSSSPSTAPKTYFARESGVPRAVATDLTTVRSGTNVFGVNITNASNYGNFNITGEIIPDEPVGTKICYALSVQPRRHDDNQWQHSTPRCVIVSKSPKVQVLGGDLIVGRKTAYNVAPTGGSNVVTSVSYAHNAGRYHGSWSEYAIIPSGKVTGMASGALYAGGSPTSDLCGLSVLTVANTLNAGCQQTAIGSYSSSSPAPDIASRFPATRSINTGSVDISTLTPIQQVYSVAGSTLNITSSKPFGYDADSGKGKWIVINDRDATVTIRSNINYASTQTLHEVNDIPQVVIIAKNIIIDESVTNVDAWLIAVGTGNDGYINTCGSVATGHPTSSTLNAKRCAGPNSANNPAPLTINGPILANKLYLYRTAGSGTGTRVGDPAEIFNLRADAYIWASGYSPGIGRVPTVTTKELPPRF